MKFLTPILLLILANVFMTLAWYGHLKYKEYTWAHSFNMMHMILISWGIAFFEYCIQVPANRLGYIGNQGAFSLVQLKIIQEVITLIVFFTFAFIFFKQETFRFNHLISAVFLVCAVYFAFKK
jgi:uncharacterized protein (DUF486 family)